MKIAIYPGSFDPITKGHLDVLETGAEIFDKVIIAVAKNSEKHGFLTIEERVELIRQSCAHLNNVEVDSFDGLTIDYAAKKGATILLRGLRAVSDFEYEFQMAIANKKLNPELETIFLTADADSTFLSSSMVREIGSMGGDIRNFVPACVHERIAAKLRNR